MDRRGGFQGGFGSVNTGSFDNHTSVNHAERWPSSTRNQGAGPRRIGSGLRRITIDWDKPWIPVTKLGRLVKDGRVATIEEIYYKSIPILVTESRGKKVLRSLLPEYNSATSNETERLENFGFKFGMASEIIDEKKELQEYQIVDLLVPNLKEQVLKILPVQKEVRSGLRTRFRAFVAIGDKNGHVGLGMQCAKRVSTAIRLAIYRAKTAVVPVRRAYWHTGHGLPHTIPCKVLACFPFLVFCNLNSLLLLIFQ
ncbi:unnamed protein product [Wuchereria bancrofti]|uniref:40S ribosomal protein S2 n=1 Tax=Wuchereria bancrofti TaxID=6293 RepID=A0A3P7DWT8_WUCBA|nr:unnamed protein product [Wuchereria bancrofti]